MSFKSNNILSHLEYKNLLFGGVLVTVLFLRILTNSSPYRDGDRVRIATRVLSEPIRYESSRGVYIAGLWTYVDLYPEINYGDFIIIEGVVEKDKLKDPLIVEVKENPNPLFVFRKKLNDFYAKSLPSPHNALVAGFVLGSKSLMPDGFWEILKRTGTAHVVVASGMNVTLVAGFLISFSILLVPRRKAIVVSLVGIWIYALLAGFDAPVIRAAIMGSVAFTAQSLGRINTAWRALVISALIMLIINPDWVNDLGFILSFVATASLMVFERPIRNKLSLIPKILRGDLSTSLAAQIGVTPILFVTFGYFNILSPLINALVLWVVAPVTIIGAMAGILGLVYEPIGNLIILLVYPLTTWFVSIVRLFS